MIVQAWCGTCGAGFALAEVLQGGRPGSCPRCGVLLAEDYSAVLVSTLTRLEAAASALESALRQAAALAPSLHIDRRGLAAELDEAVGDGR